MNKTLLILFTFMSGLTLSVALLAGSDGHEEDEHHEARDRDHDDDDHYEREGWRSRVFGGTRTAPFEARSPDPVYATYSSECGDCHMAYPPGMLAKESWRAVMANLDDHFGDNAELDAETASEIGRFLDRHGARVIAGEKSALPARITQTGWFRAQHHEIPARMVKDNPGVQSFSRCEACHTRAAAGNFNEHDVRIPGYGYWDD